MTTAYLRLSPEAHAAVRLLAAWRGETIDATVRWAIMALPDLPPELRVLLAAHLDEPCPTD